MTVEPGPEVDLHDPEFQQDPHPHYARLRPEGVCHITANDVHLVLDFDLALEVLRDTDRFSSRLGSGQQPPPPEVADEVRRIMAGGLRLSRTLHDNDPPDHSRYRRLVSRAFTGRQTERLRPFVESTTRDLLRSWSDPGDVELVADFAVPLPVRVIAHALNIPEERADDFKRWSDATIRTVGADVPADEHAEIAHAIVELQHFLVDQLEQRRSDPRDDLLTTLLNAHVGAEDDGSDARPLEVRELALIVQQLLVAGNETTTKMLVETIRLVAETPGEWQRIRADPSAVPSVVEEGLRLSCPAQGMPRVATRDTEVGGVPIPEGARLVVMFAAASRDGHKFIDPDRYDPDRTDLRDHLAFGHGVHYCVGAGLARLEGAVALEQLTATFSDVRLHDDNDFEYLPSFVLRGLKRLHVGFDSEP